MMHQATIHVKLSDGTREKPSLSEGRLVIRRATRGLPTLYCCLLEAESQINSVAGQLRLYLFVCFLFAHECPERVDLAAAEA